MVNKRTQSMAKQRVKRPFRTKETISYNNTGVTSYKDILYEVVPEFLHTHAQESFLKWFCVREYLYFSTMKLGPYLC